MALSKSMLNIYLTHIDRKRNIIFIYLYWPKYLLPMSIHKLVLKKYDWHITLASNVQYWWWQSWFLWICQGSEYITHKMRCFGILNILCWRNLRNIRCRKTLWTLFSSLNQVIGSSCALPYAKKKKHSYPQTWTDAERNPNKQVLLTILLVN